MQLWNADTGKLICRQLPVYGTSHSLNSSNWYDEAGYIAIPPCLFGPESEGLEPSPYAPPPPPHNMDYPPTRWP